MAQITQSFALAGTIPSVIVKGRIVDVDAPRYTVAVASEYTKKVLMGVSFATPYGHHNNGEGVYAMPEVGSVCWMCEPSDGNRPFVLAWCPVYTPQEGFRSNRQELNPGDIYLGTRDENFLMLRRGGVVQIGGGPLSQRMYIPITNAIKDFCQSYCLTSLAGELEWYVGDVEEDSSGDRPTSLKIRARHKASDSKPIAELEIGSHDDDTVLSLVIKKDGSDNAETKISLQMAKDGKISWKIADEWKLESEGDIVITTSGAGKKVVLKSESGDVEIEAGQVFKAKGMQATLEGDTVATVKANVVKLDGTVVKLGGDGATSLAVKGDVLASLFAAHTHTVTVPGAPTGVPLNAGSVSSMLSTTVMLK